MKINNKILKNCDYSTILLYTVSSIMYVLIFCRTYGTHILNPSYIDWLLTGDRDLTQHYLGWLSFRNSPWMFPFGMTKELTYPFSTSVIFTDSIPLFAVIFKIIRFLLPEPFQYFGLWGCICFILQGIVSEKILKDILNSKIQIFLSSILFVICPIMLRKMFIHTALAGHWILLLGLYAFIKRENCIKKQCILWAFIGFLSSSTHIFFVAMNGFIISGLTLKLLLNNRNIKSFYPMMFYLSFSIATIALLGGFSNETAQAAAEGWGVNSMNLNAFLNPQTWSTVLKDSPIREGQYEGFAYIGLGTIILLLTTTSQLFTTITIKKITGTWRIWLPFIFVFLLAFCFAMTNTITLNDKILCHIHFSPVLEKYLSTFRASGRFSWVCVYMIMIYSIKSVSCISKKNIQVFLIVIAVTLHIYDLTPCLNYHNKIFNQIKIYQNEIAKNETLNEIIQNNSITNVYISSDIIRNDLFAISTITLKSKKKLNRFYISHGKDELFDKKFEEIIQTPKEECAYIFKLREEPKASFYDLHFYLAEDYLIGTVNEFPNLQEYKIIKSIDNSEIDALFF